MKNLEEELQETAIWTEYSKRVNYLRNKNMFANTETNYNYYYGNQLENLDIGNMKPVILNVIKPIIKYKTGVVNSNEYQIVYSANNHEQPEFQKQMEELVKNLNKYANKTWELEQVNKKVRKVVKDACINDEGILYKYNEEVDGINFTRCEVLSKNNVLYGNENEEEIELQPDIIIRFRKPVEVAKEIALNNGIPKSEIELIVSDDETTEEAGYGMPEEITPMCMILLKLYKKEYEGKKRLYSIMTTKNVIIQKEELSGGTLYPIAHFTWEDVEGSARGLGCVKYNIGNQDEINKTAMRRSISVQMGAYPRLAVNEEGLTNPGALDEVGSPLKFSGQTITNVKDRVGFLIPATMSPDSKTLQEELIQHTRDFEGAGDISTGNINPEQASGKAILAVQQASQMPLNEQIDRFKSFLENVARIDFDMWQYYNTEGMTITATTKLEDNTEIEEAYVIPEQILLQLKTNVKVDITPKSAFDKYAQEISWENMLKAGLITFEEYVEGLDDDAVMNKTKLDKLISKRAVARKQIEAAQEEANAQGLDLQRQLNQMQSESMEDGGVVDEMSTM